MKTNFYECFDKNYPFEILLCMVDDEIQMYEKYYSLVILNFIFIISIT